MLQDDRRIAPQACQSVPPSGWPELLQDLCPNGDGTPMAGEGPSGHERPHPSINNLGGRANALRHGLTARTLLPQVLQDDAINQYQHAFQVEWQPATPTEQVLVQELARHAAALRRAQQAEGALLRESALAAVDRWPVQEDAQDCPVDRLLAASVATEGIDRLTRYRRAHEKAFLATLTKLREAKASRPLPNVATPTPSVCFPTEADCAAYLLSRLQRKECGCPRCGARQGYWLGSRQRWQCAGCHLQFGLRAGTVMAGSHLPLSTWFRAIRLLVQIPNVSNAALRTAMATHRPATACRIGKKIRAALGSQNASALLAGLNRVFDSATGRLLQQTSSADQNLQNELP